MASPSSGAWCTTAAHFEDFIVGLKRKSEGRRTLIVLDNLKIHYAKKNNHLYSKDFKLFLSLI